MLIIILSAIAALIMALIITVALRPRDVAITRTATINATPAAVYAQVVDFHRWAAWSPWTALDPAAVISYAGSASGVGAVYSWDGNKKMGAGRMTIAACTPPGLVRIDLRFTRPFTSTNVAEFTFTEAAGRTVVSWTMRSHNGFIAKAFAMIVDFDAMVGGDFAKGLAAMKAVVEAGSTAPAAG